AWEDALRADRWNRPPVWSHGDLLAGNLLARDGRLAAVIDFAGLGVGDPACDLMIAWGLFSGASRAAFREALRNSIRLDEATWARGRGHALYHAAIYIPYYRHANPAGVAAARHQLGAVEPDPLHAQVRHEALPKRVEVYDSAALVELRDARRREVRLERALLRDGAPRLQLPLLRGRPTDLEQGRLAVAPLEGAK